MRPALRRIPERIERAVPLMVHEAVVNALKHGQPSRVAVSVQGAADELRVVVTDDGGGFPFRGLYDHAALAASKNGPKSLLDRVSALGGRHLDRVERRRLARRNDPGRRVTRVARIRLILADDHSIVLDGLRRLFESEPDFEVVATCADGVAALEAVRTTAVRRAASSTSRCPAKPASKCCKRWRRSISRAAPCS